MIPTLSTCFSRILGESSEIIYMKAVCVMWNSIQVLVIMNSWLVLME